MMPLDDGTITIKLLRNVKLCRIILRMDNNITTCGVVSISVDRIICKNIARCVVLPTAAPSIRKSNGVRGSRNVTPISSIVSSLIPPDIMCVSLPIRHGKGGRIANLIQEISHLISVTYLIAIPTGLDGFDILYFPPEYILVFSTECTYDQNILGL